MDYKKKRTIILAVIFLAYWISFLNRSLTSPTLPLLIKDWGITMAGAGALTSIMLLTYSLGHVPFGLLADKFGRSKFIVLGTATVGIFNVLLSYTKTFASFLGLRGIIGLGAAANHAPLMALVNDWFPANRRGLAMSALSMVTTVGPLTALLWGKALIAKYGGWQPVYYYTAIPAAIIIILAIIFVRDPEKEDKEAVLAEEMEYMKKIGKTPAPPSTEGHHFTWNSLSTLFTKKDLWVLYLSWFLVLCEFMILIGFLPTLLVKVKGVELQSAISISTGWLWTGVFVSLLAGWISDHFKHRKWYVFWLLLPGHFIVMSIPFLPVNMIFPVLCVLGVCWFGTSGAYYAWSAEISARVNPVLVATILGFCVLFGDLGGAFGTQVAGKLADILGLQSMFWVAGITGILLNISFLFLPDPYKEAH